MTEFILVKLQTATYSKQTATLTLREFTRDYFRNMF